MAKPRRGVKFSHRNGHGSGTDGRRSSFSDISEAASEPGSPDKSANGGDTIVVVRHTTFRSFRAPANELSQATARDI
jgi:hypothetical protein